MTVVPFTGETKGPIPVETIADAARDLDSILVIGWDKNDEFHMASSEGHTADLLLLLELCRKRLLAEFEE